uniref:CoA transferase n=1 Tax=Rhizobium sp. RCAM05350 TaxID=2895568 RepID=UPI002076B727|nr:CoA transferase [Rhizobium sp. RCAM05350]
MDLQGEALVNWFAGGIDRNALDREKSLATWFHQAPYGVYPASDGHVVVSLCETSNLADAVDSDALRALVDNDRYEDRDAFARALSEATHRFTMAELEERFDANNVWWAPVRYYDELLSGSTDHAFRDFPRSGCPRPEDPSRQSPEQIRRQGS